MVTRIDAELLIPGRGEPIAGGTVVCEGATITYAGHRAGAPDTPGADAVHAPVVMPGLWDCHGHFIGVRTASISATYTDPVALRAARVARDAAAALNAGFTSIREAGGLGVHLARAIDEGTMPGLGPSSTAPTSTTRCAQRCGISMPSSCRPATSSCSL